MVCQSKYATQKSVTLNWGELLDHGHHFGITNIPCLKTSLNEVTTHITTVCLPKNKVYKTKNAVFFKKAIKSSTLKNSKANILHAFYLHAWSFSHLTLNLRKLLIESSANDWHWIISQNNDPFFLASVLVKKFLSRPSFSSPLYTPRGIFFFDNSVYSPNCIT